MEPLFTVAPDKTKNQRAVGGVEHGGARSEGRAVPHVIQAQPTGKTFPFALLAAFSFHLAAVVRLPQAVKEKEGKAGSAAETRRASPRRRCTRAK